MPHIRVDLNEARRAEQSAISAGLHRALVTGLDMIDDDLFQIFTFHGDGDLVFSRSFPAADRGEIIFIQVLASHGYTADLKQRMYRDIVANLTAIGIPQDTLLISVVEIDGAANWHSPPAAA